jgi:hypothetical protein
MFWKTPPSDTKIKFLAEDDGVDDPAPFSGRMRWMRIGGPVIDLAWWKEKTGHLRKKRQKWFRGKGKVIPFKRPR